MQEETTVCLEAGLYTWGLLNTNPTKVTGSKLPTALSQGTLIVIQLAKTQQLLEKIGHSAERTLNNTLKNGHRDVTI